MSETKSSSSVSASVLTMISQPMSNSGNNVGAAIGTSEQMSTLLEHEKSSTSSSSTTSSSGASNNAISSSLTSSNSNSGVSSSSVGPPNNGIQTRKITGSGKSDEAIYKMAPEAVDPAILSRSLSMRRYTRSALLLLREDYLSRVNPACFNEPRLSQLGVWKSDASNYLNQNGGGGNSGGGGGGGGGSGNSGGSNGGNVRAISGGGGLSGSGSNSGSNNQKSLMDHRNVSTALMPAFMKRRIVANNTNNSNSSGGGSSSDPKERVRKDQDSVVTLSPQRKSINMGCQMPAASHVERELPGGGTGGTVRERRIGSGRLPPRDVNWDYRPDKDGPDGEYNNYRSNMGNSYRDHRNTGNNSNNSERNSEYRERYRSYGRNDYERGENRDNANYVRRFISDLANQHSNNSGGGNSNNVNSNNDRRRQYSESRNEEPEWFSGGPTSQHDTIELRGFDENEDMNAYNSGGHNQKSSHKHNRDSHHHHHHHHHQQKQNSQQKNSQHQQQSQQIQSSQHSGQQKSKSGKNSQVNKEETASIKTSEAIPDDVEPINSNPTSPPPARSTPTKVANDTNNNTNEEKPKKDDKKPKDEKEKHVEFNFEAFLNVDPLNNTLVGDPKIRDAGSSRFSQWFQRTGEQFPHHKSANDSRRSSLHEELINASNGGENPSPSNRSNGHNSGSDSEKYFAPISPAAANSQTNTLLEFLQKGKFNSKSGGMPVILPGMAGTTNTGYPDKQKPGTIPSVEELEARMRKNEPSVNSNMNAFGQLLSNNLQQQMGQMNTNNSSPQEMEAFKKLMEQLAPAGKNNSATGVNVLSAVLQGQQQQQLMLQQIITRAKQEELKKLIQQQHLQQQIQQRNNLQQIRLNELLLKITNGKLSRNDIFRKPEVQVIVQGLIRGEITQAHLHQQLASVTISARYREAIVAIINYLNTSSRVTSPILGAQQILSPIPGQQQSQQASGQQSVPPGQQQQQQQQPPQQQQQPQQQPTSSSGNSTGLSQRIPSPRELQYHTQTIMQSALIKKKLEEQQENYRRRQEIQKHQGGTQQNSVVVGDDGIMAVQSLTYVHGTSPPPNKQQHSQSQQINSPTPLAFTPTSVLRKMTAEKDSFLAASTAAVAAIENAKTLQANNKALHSILMPNLAHQQTQQSPAQSQPRMILGGGSNVQAQPQQNQSSIGAGANQPISPGGNLQQVMRSNPMKWNQMNMNQLSLNKPMGRPILKGGPTPATSAATQPIMAQQMAYVSKLEFQQMQQQQQQQKQQPPQQPRSNPQQQQNLLLSQMQQQQHLQQLFQQRQRAAMRAQQYQQMQYHHHMMQQQQPGTPNSHPTAMPAAASNQQLNESSPQVQNAPVNPGAAGTPGVVGATGGNIVGPVNNPSVAGTPGPGGIINYQRDGGLSPTSNQLARWFSPELLAQASAGKLPSLNMGQALSLEEFERSIQHSSAAVHN